MTTATKTDEALLEDFVGGDNSAIDQLHGRHARKMRAFIINRFMDRRDPRIDDVIQQAFLRLIQNHHRFDRSKKLRPWLYTLAANACIDILRRDSRHVFLTSLDKLRWGRRHTNLDEVLESVDHEEFVEFDTPDDLAADPSEEVWADERDAILLDLLPSLRDQDRAAVELIYFQGKTFSQAADALGVPLGTLKTRIHRAIGFMRNRLSTQAGFSVAA